jgi:hypothetical protein
MRARERELGVHQAAVRAACGKQLAVPTDLGDGAIVVFDPRL